MNKRFEAVLMLDEEAQDKKYGDCQVVQMGSQYYYLVPIEDEWISENQNRLEYLESLINTPEIEDFLEGVKLEAAHQTERWGVEHEENKYPHDYALVMDKLKGKQALAIWDKDSEKYKHHLITLAAVCSNAHRQIKKEGTGMNRFFLPPSPKDTEQTKPLDK